MCRPKGGHALIKISAGSSVASRILTTTIREKLTITFVSATTVSIMLAAEAWRNQMRTTNGKYLPSAANSIQRKISPSRVVLPFEARRLSKHYQSSKERKK